VPPLLGNKHPFRGPVDQVLLLLDERGGGGGGGGEITCGTESTCFYFFLFFHGTSYPLQFVGGNISRRRESCDDDEPSYF